MVQLVRSARAESPVWAGGIEHLHEHGCDKFWTSCERGSYRRRRGGGGVARESRRLRFGTNDGFDVAQLAVYQPGGRDERVAIRRNVPGKRSESLLPATCL